MWKTLSSGLEKDGFCICEGFHVNHYNTLVPKYALPTYQRSDPIGFVIGATKEFWTPFSNHLRKSGKISPDPVDSYCRNTIQQTIQQTISEYNSTNTEKVEYDLRFYDSPPKSGKFVHVQTAGHVAGFAYYDGDTFWSASGKYGVWFVYRAVLVVNMNFGELGVPEPVLPLPVLSEKEKMEIERLTKLAEETFWQDSSILLQIRDVCEVGKLEWRYSGSLLDYFYPIQTTKTQVLHSILQQPHET
uniref:Cyanocobalamin reductase (cyanide-eliminating) n=1 Tax=Arcella intermedia TaxID=1963864 RepID=A0A6B2LG05_9EUKA